MSKNDVFKKLGKIGEFINTLVVLAHTPWGVVISTVLMAVTAWLISIVEWAQGPRTLAALSIFLFLFWTYIGLLFLVSLRKPREIKTFQDYSYNLTFEGLIPTYDPKSEEVALGFGIQFRNFSAHPILYTVESFDVRIGTRSLPRFKKGALKSYLPRGAGRTSNNVPFQRKDIQEFLNGKRIEGSVEFVVSYGHPEHPPVRKLSMVLTTIFVFNEDGTFGYNAGIAEENDEPLNKP